MPGSDEQSITATKQPWWRPRPWHRQAFQVLRAVLALLIIAILATKLRSIGWAQTWAFLPEHAGFYLATAIGFVIYPATEVMIYKSLWGTGWPSITAFIRKRAYNELVFNYSGEVFLMAWARENIQRTDKELFSNIKDVNLLSGFISSAITLALLGALIVSEQGAAFLALNQSGNELALPVTIIALSMMLIFVFRRRLFALAGPQVLVISGWHVARGMAMLLLQVAQWSFALPDMPAANWLTFLTVQMLLTRLSFLPNQDVLFMWVGIAMAQLISAPEAAVTSMFVAAGTLSVVVQIAAFVLTTRFGRKPAV